MSNLFNVILMIPMRDNPQIFSEMAIETWPLEGIGDTLEAMGYWLDIGDLREHFGRASTNSKQSTLNAYP